MAHKRIAVVPGDGIGVDVTAEVVKVVQTCNDVTGRTVDMTHYDYGAEKYLKTGISMPSGGYEDLAGYDAIFMGAFGDPRIPDMRHAADILLGTRFVLDLYVNYRPVSLFDERLCPLKGIKPGDIDIAIFRENTEGLYVGMGGNFKKNTPDEIAIQEDINTRKGVQRIIEYAFEFAAKNNRKKVCMTDKSNVLTYGHDLWQRVFKDVGSRYPDIQRTHMYVDALSMQLIKDPRAFDVIVTNNMFGDIITDIGAQLQGGLGMAASANINPKGTAMFEPVHGSAPKYAGKDVANPFGAILTAQLMYQHLHMNDEAQLIENAVKSAIQENQTTQDLGGSLGTKAVGDYLCKVIKKSQSKVERE
jgi:3-isopropylmalate dehydrogenase